MAGHGDSEEEAGDRPLAVVDIDGVVADTRHRLHHIRGRRRDWDAFFDAASDDPPHAEGLRLVALLRHEHDVVFIPGRPERCRADTEAWLDAHGIGGHPVHMRREGDRRPAARIKVDVLRRLDAERRVALVVDDDPDVLAAVAAAGFATAVADWEQRALDDEDALRAAQEGEGRT